MKEKTGSKIWVFVVVAYLLTIATCVIITHRQARQYVKLGKNPKNIIEIHGNAIAELRKQYKSMEAYQETYHNLKEQIDMLAEDNKNLPRCALCGKVRFETFYLIECSELQLEQLVTDDDFFYSSREEAEAHSEAIREHNGRLRKHGMPICERCAHREMAWLAKQYYEKKGCKK